MVQKNVKTYTEVKIAGTDFRRSYRNPLMKVYQYEYALYEAASGLFRRVECKSMSIENLRMYFLELPPKDMNVDDDLLSGTEGNNDSAQKPPKMNREKVLKEMEVLVADKVSGKVLFPMMDRCAADASTVMAKDGTHWFVFTDGVYGFALHLIFGDRGKLSGIEVRDFNHKMTPVKAEDKKGKASGKNKKSVRPEVA